MTSPPWITFCKQSKMLPNALYRLNVLHITSQQTRGSNEYIYRKWVWIMDGRTKSLNNVLILPALLWMRKGIFKYMSRSGTRNFSFCAKSEAQDTDSTTFQLKAILVIDVLNCTGVYWGSCRDCRIRSLSLRARISECLPHNSGGDNCCSGQQGCRSAPSSTKANSNVHCTRWGCSYPAIGVSGSTVRSESTVTDAVE